MKTLGKKVRELRERRGWTQAQLAEKVGYSSSAGVNEVEQGRANASAERLVRLADAFGVSVGDLLELEPEPRGRAQTPGPSTRQAIARATRAEDITLSDIAELCRKLEPEDADLVLQLTSLAIERLAE